MPNSPIIYTHTDEAPALATYSLLPIVRAFARPAGVEVDTRDISLAARVLATMGEYLEPSQRVSDDLAELGELALEPEANIIKLPNISASIPQLEATIEELQAAGYKLPDYPAEPSTDEERKVKALYDKVKGSAVNPVLREGNSDRRAPNAVKNFARNHPHSMGDWSAESKTTVATMDADDFYHNEKSHTMDRAGSLTFELITDDGTTTLREPLTVQDGEVVDATFMSRSALVEFLKAQVAEAKERGVLFSVHLKATMMKVSDPILFGHTVEAYFADVFDRYGAELKAAGAEPDNGLGQVLEAVSGMEDPLRSEIQAAFAAALDDGPPLAMVNSDKGITNLHVPSDVIIDASMPAMIRTSGQMWNADGNQQDTLAVIPDSSYAGLYDETIEFCKLNGAFDPTSMGTVPNVGLMAKKAEEYGSHDKTFEIPADGKVRIADDQGNVIFEDAVQAGDIWRMCQTKHDPIIDWVHLAVSRARATGWPAVFWLDENRAHDAELIAKVRPALDEIDTDGLEVHIMAPVEATRFTLERVKSGLNTISVTGNVLRDYLTDLFPILELGTSAKMLSIVPLMNGGGLFETGAGGSAPKHVQQFEAENHLRWDSLGEFLALTVSLEQYAQFTGNPKAQVLADALDAATEKLLNEGRSPSRKVNELDNRGSHFYLALYWAEALAAQGEDADLAARFAPLAEALAANEETIVNELNEVQGEPAEIGGYYYPNPERAAAAMRPSATLNGLIDSFAQ